MNGSVWLPYSEYRPEYGRVVVWLMWGQYDSIAGRMGKAGQWVAAYQIAANGIQVWVGEHDSIPIETTGRRVTHFTMLKEPA